MIINPKELNRKINAESWAIRMGLRGFFVTLPKAHSAHDMIRVMDTLFGKIAKRLDKPKEEILEMEELEITKDEEGYYRTLIRYLEK